MFKVTEKPSAQPRCRNNRQPGVSQMRATITAIALTTAMLCSPAQAQGYEDTTSVREYCENIADYVENRASGIVDAKLGGHHPLDAARAYAFDDTLRGLPTFNGREKREAMSDFLRDLTIRIYSENMNTNWGAYVQSVGTVTMMGCMEGTKR